MSKEISKFLSLVLRHAPEKIGITLDANGWVDVDVLLAAATASGVAIDRATIDRVVADNDKKRFTFSADGERIRAAQGHSVSVDLALVPSTPPDVLFHGTAVTSLASILATGLSSRSRQHVHLSHDEATATRVGSRHGRPVVLHVDAAAMHRDGHLFFCADNGVWLTEAVPTAYLREI
ncbi:RNA 2'-phosphotransferase [Methylobrevis pamukkalensis]|uniref:Probable RNA 2'-phosphotransferase n=1 Tax=Methylobrevis pamukkalensis TaxID=1439726 RepID=A0A1E3H814_9HYPH|nr:RNA 2'-phosphotransferase [Methylobrevis pamukkalensis]ODN71641.1 RNA 2'-phosphotransferase [Methylobrevis pamukkalensis]